MDTDLLYLRDAYLRDFTAMVVGVEPIDGGARAALDRTAFYPTGGGQPHDIGRLGEATVVDVRKEGGLVWHYLDGPAPQPGDSVEGVVDWERRHALMRTHSALHVLCGVIWNEWRVPVTGGNMEPLSARMDFEFDPLPEGFAARVEELVNAELERARPIEVAFLPRGAAVEDEDLIRTNVQVSPVPFDDLVRTKENRVPQGLTEVRIVEIVGLDSQADGGTHVRNTAEVGRVRVVKTENKGKGNKRVRLVVEDR
jgi:misacylated tRNA(Ala) deacylase